MSLGVSLLAVFVGMWMSKTVQPLFFASEGKLGYFGLSYAVMAVAGAASVVVGYLSDWLGIRCVIQLGSLLDSAAPLLASSRAPSGLLTSGALAGVGVSRPARAFALGAKASNAGDRSPVVAVRLMVTNVGTALGALIAGFLLAGVDATQRAIRMRSWSLRLSRCSLPRSCQRFGRARGRSKDAGSSFLRVLAERPAPRGRRPRPRGTVLLLHQPDRSIRPVDPQAISIVYSYDRRRARGTASQGVIHPRTRISPNARACPPSFAARRSPLSDARPRV